MSQPAELKEKIDELALHMVMADSDGPAASLACLDALEKIRESASRTQMNAVVTVAAALLNALPTADHPAAMLGEGLAALQNALEQTGTAAARAPSASSPANDPELMNDFILESGEQTRWLADLMADSSSASAVDAG